MQAIPSFTNDISSTAKAYVYNHRMLLSLDDSRAQENALYEKWHALDGVDQALSNITRRLTDLEQKGLIKYLPNTLFVKTRYNPRLNYANVYQCFILGLPFHVARIRFWVRSSR